MRSLIALSLLALLATACGSPSATSGTTAAPISPIPTPTAVAVSVVGAWADKAQPDTVRLEFDPDGQMRFMLRVKTTIQGQSPTYSDWSTVATLPWRQIGLDRLLIGAGDKVETWRIDTTSNSLIQPKSGGGTIEFIRP